MEISFTPSPDVVVILNALLDKFENRAKRNHVVSEAEGTYHTTLFTQHAARSIKILLADLPLPTYFSQTDPEPRLIANKQLQELAKHNLITLSWLPGEINHLLQSIILQTEHAPRNTHHAPLSTQHESLYTLLDREPISNTRARLETTLLADQFRFSKDDWRARAIHRTLDQLRARKSPAPFSLTDSTWNLDLLAVLSALPNLEAETPYRVFSVRTFNDSKRFDGIKSALVRLARLANPEWKLLSAEDILRELNLVANPSYIHLAGAWQLTTQTGEILSLSGFTPSIGFPAAQVETIQSVTVHPESVLCIENLTSFHEFTRTNGTHPTLHATLCLMGNPSPSIRRLLRLIPETTPIYLWLDMDYGGFNILSQLRKQVSTRVQPYRMDVATFENYSRLSRPLTQTDRRNLKRLTLNPNLKDIHPIIVHLLKCGLKLEQEAIRLSTT
jgi:hypothetical protein